MNNLATDRATLLHKASRIPSMGGAEIGPALRSFAQQVQADTAIVEVGCWLGAGTAQLALGLMENEKRDSVSIHCFDRWMANQAELKKAALRGLDLEVGEDLLPHVQRLLEPFSQVSMTFHQGDIRQAAWDGTPISLYIDDAAKKPKLFFHILSTFAPSWIPGKTIICLMDYDIWEKTGQVEHRCQQDFIEAHSAHFERLPWDNLAAFRYLHPVNFRSWVEARSVPSLSKLQAEIEVLQRQLGERERELREREREILAMKTSLSWKLTAPVRGAAVFARQLHREEPR